jgi:hypothetical protein
MAIVDELKSVNGTGRNAKRLAQPCVCTEYGGTSKDEVGTVRTLPLLIPYPLASPSTKRDTLTAVHSKSRILLPNYRWLCIIMTIRWRSIAGAEMRHATRQGWIQCAASVIVPTGNHYNYGSQIKRLILRQVCCYKPHFSPRKAAFWSGEKRSPRRLRPAVDEAGTAGFSVLSTYFLAPCSSRLNKYVYHFLGSSHLIPDTGSLTFVSFMRTQKLAFLILLLRSAIAGAYFAPNGQCGRQYGGALCNPGLGGICCSINGQAVHISTLSRLNTDRSPDSAVPLNHSMAIRGPTRLNIADL